MTLSNGVVVTLWADIQTDVSSVQEVDYVLHVPKGVTLTGVSYDANGSLEHLQIVADQTGTHYADTTTVYTTVAKIGYTAYATRRDNTVASKNGVSGSSVTLNWCT